MAEEKKPTSFAMAPIAEVKTATSYLESQKGKPTVTMHFPRKVLLTLKNNERIFFEAGVQEVPASLQEDNWLKLNGVEVYDAEAARKKAAADVLVSGMAKLSDKQKEAVEFLISDGDYSPAEALEHIQEEGFREVLAEKEKKAKATQESKQPDGKQKDGKQK